MPKIRPLDPLFDKKTMVVAYIRQAMKDKRISQVKMAESLGMYQSGFSYKMSTKALTLDDLIKIFDVLDTPKEKIGELLK